MPKITELYAFVIEREGGPNDEGIIGMWTPDNSMMLPMVGADMKRVEDLRKYADEVSLMANKPYKLLKFKLVGEIERKPMKKSDYHS